MKKTTGYTVDSLVNIILE